MSATICRFIRVNGNRCGSPALSSKPFCYYHDRDTQRHRAISGKAPLDISRIPADHLKLAEENHLVAQYYGLRPDSNPIRLEFPSLEDRASIQVALSMILSALAQDRIDPKRATSILYGLQVASSNATDADLHSSSAITETIHDLESGLDIAPDSDPQPDPDHLAFLEDLLREDAQEAKDLEEDAERDD